MDVLNNFLSGAKNTTMKPFIWLFVASLVVGSSGGLVEDITEKIGSFSSHFYDHAVVVSFVNSTHKFDLEVGYSDFVGEKSIPATIDHRFLFGSITKLYTSVAIMRLVESKKLQLDEPVYPYVDYYLSKNGTSLVQLFGSRAVNITVRHLLQMRAGLREYDNYQLRVWQNANPNLDFTPIDILHYIPNKSLRCDPGTCGAYSSIHFTILGFVLARVAGAETWDAYDQSSAFPEYEKLVFPRHGPARTFGDPTNPVIHGYQQQNHWIDVYNTSALAGWTCGNLITDAPTQAGFFYDLLGNASQSILSPESIDSMLEFQFLESSATWQGEYGLGVQVLPQGTPESGSYYGHGGETYGFETSVGYNKKLDFSLVVASNMESAAGWHLGTLHTDIYKLVVQNICGSDCDSVTTIGCSDQGGFVDEGGADCSGWKGYNCTDAVEQWDYTSIGRDMLVANCPVTCEDVECPDPNSQKPYAVYRAGESEYYIHSRITFRGQTDGVIGISGGTIEDCMRECDSIPNCNNFAATISGTFKCYLKPRCIFPSDILVSETLSKDYESVPLRTYFKPCLEGKYWHSGSNSFPHNPSLALKQIGEVNVTKCAEECDSHPECFSFTVDDPNSSQTTCHLMKGKVTPKNVENFYYAPIGGVISTTCMYVTYGNLESCALSCEAAQPTLLQESVLATCKSFTFNEQARTCCLSDNIIHEDITGKVGDQQTFRSDIPFSPTYFAAVYQQPAESRDFVSLGWCLDWCNDYHFIKKVECVGFSYSGSTCQVFTESFKDIYPNQVSQLWSRQPNRKSYWLSTSPRGCCVANSKAFPNMTHDECLLMSHRVVFHEGDECHDQALVVEPDTQETNQPSPYPTATPSLIPSTSGPQTSMPTPLPTPTPTAIPTQPPTTTPTAIPSNAPVISHEDSYQMGFIISVLFVVIILLVLLKLYWKYTKRGNLIEKLKNGEKGETLNELSGGSPREEIIELREEEVEVVELTACGEEPLEE